MKEKFLSKNSANSATLNLVRGPFEFANNEAKSILENDIFESTCLY